MDWRRLFGRSGKPKPGDYHDPAPFVRTFLEKDSKLARELRAADEERIARIRARSGSYDWDQMQRDNAIENDIKARRSTLWQNLTDQECRRGLKDVYLAIQNAPIAAATNNESEEDYGLKHDEFMFGHSRL